MSAKETVFFSEATSISSMPDSNVWTRGHNVFISLTISAKSTLLSPVKFLSLRTDFVERLETSLNSLSTFTTMLSSWSLLLCSFGDGLYKQCKLRYRVYLMLLFIIAAWSSPKKGRLYANIFLKAELREIHLYCSKRSLTGNANGIILHVCHIFSSLNRDMLFTQEIHWNCALNLSLHNCTSKPD